MIPARVREARREAGLSLAQLAKADVSRTFIHFVEKGKARPSKQVLVLIARRTGKPISYFLAQPPTGANSELTAELTEVANHIRRIAANQQLSSLEREAMRLVELSLLHALRLSEAAKV